MIRSRQIVPTSAIVSTLLMGFDALRELINNIDRSDEMDISGHSAALARVATASLPEEEKDSVSKSVEIRLPSGGVIFTVPMLDIALARKEGKCIYLVEYDLINDVQRKGKTPLQVLNNMLDTGIIIESRVDISAVGRLEDDALDNRLPFFVLFGTIVEPDIIGAVCEVSEDKVHFIPEDTVANRGEEGAGPGPAPGGIPSHVSSAMETPRGAPSYSGPSVPEALHGDEAAGNSAMDVDREIRFEVSREDPVASRPASAPPPFARDAPGNIGDGGAGAAPPPRKAAAPAETNLRVQISLLDTLMILAGEMVLSRNQLLQAVSSKESHAIELSAQKINMVTSELQEAIMLTRMQPIGNIMNKFPRVVRDLAGQLGKEIELVLEGKEVELDKTIIEGLGDPLTHLLRNSIDHGIELPDERAKTGKNPAGVIVLKAYHEAGQVNIEISDDGKGIDGNRVASSAVSKGLISAEQSRTMSDKEKIGLIFLPGASTAEKVTDISGRGVGMDVVKTNLDKLGGIIDVESKPLQGTSIRIKLPLTLAIIPSLIVSVGEERYAIPQVNVDELLRIPASQIKERIEKVGDAEVVRLRETLLPLLHLAEVLDLERTYIDPRDGVRKPDRREGTAERRCRKEPLFRDGAEEDPESRGCPENGGDGGDGGDGEDKRRWKSDRRYRSSSTVNIVVVSAGTFKYGLVIEKLHDSEEIVVKPLGKHLKQCRGYAGATIMGDGRVALILDVGSLARMAALTSLSGTDRAVELAREAAKAASEDNQSLLLFRNGPGEQFAVPLDMVARVEKIDAADIEMVGGRRVIKYRGQSLPVFSVGDVASVKPIAEAGELLVIVFSVAGREVGLLATKPIDAADIALKMDHVTLRQAGIVGSAIIGSMTTLIVDVYEMMETLNPEWFTGMKMAEPADGEKPTILLAEDSEFFRGLVKKFMEDSGCKVLTAEDGQKAWEVLQEHADEVSLVVTDIEMPNLDGYGLTKKIKGDSRFRLLKVIAVTSLAGDENIARGREVGIDDYQIKLDKEKLLASIQAFLRI